MPPPLQALEPRLPRLPGQTRQRRQPLTETQRETIAQQLGATAVSGLSRGLNILDVPGATARAVASNLLTGSSYDPLAPLKSPTTSKGRVEGRELNRRLGLAGGQDTWKNWFGGLATEIGLDPLTYTGIGALTKAGTAAKASSKLAPTFAKQVATGQRSLLSARLPFTNLERTLVGPGRGGQALATGLGNVGGAIKASPPGRAMRQLFDVRVGGRYDPAEQAAQEMAYAQRKKVEPLVRAAQYQARKEFNDLLKEYESSFGSQLQIPGAESLEQTVRLGTELRGDFARASREITGGTPSPEMMGKIKTYADSLATTRNALHQAIHDLGGDAAWLGSESANNLVRAVPTEGEFFVRGQLATQKTLPNSLSSPMSGGMGFLKQYSAPIGGKPGKILIYRRSDIPPPKHYGAYQIQHGDRAVGNAKPIAILDAGDNPTQQVRDWLKSHQDETLLKGTVAHFPRGISKKVFKNFPEMAPRFRVFPTQHGFMMRRTPEISNIPREFVNRVLADDKVFQKSASSATNHIRTQYDEFLEDDYGLDKVLEELQQANKKVGGRQVFDRNTYQSDPLVRAMVNAHAGGKLSVPTPGTAAYPGKQLHAEALHKWAQGHKSLYKKKQPLFDINSIDDNDRYIAGAAKVQASLDSVHQLFAGSGGGNVPIADAFRQIGLSQEGATRAAQKFAAANPGVTGIDAGAVAAARSVIEPLINPKRMTQLGEWIDDITKVLKVHFTLPFPAFWTRNFTSGQLINMAALVHTPQDFLAYKNAAKQAWRLRDKADSPLMQELYANRLIEHVMEDVPLGQQQSTLGGFELAPGRLRDIPREAFSAAGQQDATAFGRAVERVPVAGKAARRAVNTWVNVGDRISRQVEFANRVTPYLYLRNKGWDPVAAADKVRELQVDYSALSPFEKSTMKRVVPFYTFQRRIAFPIAKNIVQRPGGVTTQIMRATERARSDDARTPEWIQEGTSLPWQMPFWQPPTGTARYLTGLGLAHEQPARFLGPNPLREAMSDVSPLVKFPLETATGRSFFRNQPLSELDPNIGRLVSNVRELATGTPAPRGLATPFGTSVVGRPTAQFVEHLANNLPSSRYLSTARSLTDPRKLSAVGGVPVPAASMVNALTGLRLSDVSPARQDMELRRRAQEEMARLGGRSMEIHFIPEDVIKTLPRSQQEAARRYNQLQAIRK